MHTENVNPSGEIELELGALRETVNFLHETLSLFEDKLIPVLVPEIEEVAVSGTSSSKPISAVTKVGVEIRVSNNTCNDAIRRVQKLLGRLAV